MTTTAHDVMTKVSALFSQLEVHKGEARGASFDEIRAVITEHYAEDMRFIDPIQTLEGREAFLEMNEAMMRSARLLRFEMIDGAAGQDSFYLTWAFDFQPRMGPRMRFAGVTHARLEAGRVVEHRDYWDLAGGIMSAFPLANLIYRKVVSRFA